MHPENRQTTSESAFRIPIRAESRGLIKHVGVDEAARIFTGVLGLELQGKSESSKAVGIWDGSTVGDPRRWIYLQSSGERFGGICLFEDEARQYDGSLPRGWDSVELVVADVDAAASRLAGVAGATALALFIRPGAFGQGTPLQ